MILRGKDSINSGAEGLLNFFKTYDIRGELGSELNDDIIYQIARAFAVTLEAKKVVVRRDGRASSEPFLIQVIKGLPTNPEIATVEPMSFTCICI